MSDSENDHPPAKKKAGKQAIEEIYQKKSQLEHILLRPDTYIGSVEPVTENMWVFDSEQSKLVQRSVTFVPGLYKIFDEILVNAADNKQRDKKMDCIKINISPEKNEISVWNNGKGIPVEMHKDEKMYVPTMIFGHLLTSSNYNDEEEKVTGGRNGYGAKLCNIFSEKFSVETSSKDSRKRFKQTWVENMSKVGNTKIGESSSEDFTKITFQPDLKKFKMDTLDKDIVDLMARRAYDVAATTGGVKVYLNDKRVPVKNFKDYVELVLKGHNDEIGNPVKINYERANERWEVACCISDSGFQQISFVNSIATFKGGRHVDYVTDMLVKQLAEVIKKKNKGGAAVKPFQIKNHMWVFVNCLVVNPTFDSQTKETMTLQAKSFGSKCQLSDKFINTVIKSGITEAVISWAKFKAQSQLDKVGGKKKTKLKGVAKLEDANEAGSKNAHKCTLILTEGDSAKSLAVSGLGVVGRDYYGVFPLRGKLLNVREATHKQILENAEINNVIKIMGLQYKKKYNTPEDMKSLRYGKLMIMTDQDQDGSHIKGLLINFLHHNWPELLRQKFLEEFITPIVKVTKRDKVLSFYSIPEFEEWRRNTPDNHLYHIKYYKGLGTSTSKEAKEYFEDMARHKVIFKYSGNQDDNSITMAFSKKCVDQRKEWLTNWMEECKRRREMDLPEVYLYEKDTKAINFADFVNKELVLFSNADNERSIPNMMDGLKPGQRKVLFTCLKRNDKREVKVAQLAGSVAELSAYHHGEASLMSTIINLAQNYVGSNNINLLMPNGQFGTRLQGGKDAASPRYIFTMLNPVTRHLFNPNDTPLLIQQKEDNQKIEPMWYCPIIPLVLVNGADGIGTGWMTKIPNYNPREIISNVRKMIRGEEPTVMIPWYKGFTGQVEAVGHQRYVVSGEVRVLDDTTVEITELPIGVWTQNYKESVLEPMLYGNEKEKEKEKPAKGKKKAAAEEDNDKPPGKGGPVVTDFKEYHTDATVRFVVSMSERNLERFEHDGLHKTFKLQTTTTTTSMMLFDELGCMTKFDHVNNILEQFYKIRLDLYVKRKAYMLGMLKAEAKKLSNQARFIVEKCDGVISVENKKKKLMIDELLDKRYDSDPVKAWKKEVAKNMDDDDEEEKKGKNNEDSDLTEEGRDFDYILGMKLWTLTKEKKEALLGERDKKLKEVKDLESKTPEDLWTDDLDGLGAALDEQEAKEADDKNYGKVKGVAKGKAVGGRKGFLAAETMPSPKGRRIEPVIDSELRKKIEKAVTQKEKLISKKAIKTEDVDEFDAELGLNNGQSLQAAIKNSPQEVEKKLNAKRKELKQTKLTFKSSAKKSADKEFDSTGSEDDGDSDSFDANLSSTPSRSRDAPRRAAATKAKFNFNSEDEEMKSDSDFEVNKQLTEKPAPTKTVVVTSDEDSDFGGSKKKAKVLNDLESSEVLFDKMMGGGSSASSPEKEERKSSPPPKKAPPKKKLTKPDSDFEMNSSEDEFFNKNTKKKADSDSDFNGVEEKPKAKKAPPKKKDEPKKKPPPKKAKVADSDSENEKPKKKAPAKRKMAKPTSDSEDDMFPKSKKGGKKKADSSDDESDDAFGNVAPREKQDGRSRKPISYKLDSASDDDSF